MVAQCSCVLHGEAVGNGEFCVTEETRSMVALRSCLLHGEAVAQGKFFVIREKHSVMALRLCVLHGEAVAHKRRVHCHGEDTFSGSTMLMCVEW